MTTISMPRLDLQFQVAMSKQPEIYFDIGKKARDLLYRDHAQQRPLHFHYKYLNWNVNLLFQVGDIWPGLSTYLKFMMPFQKFNTVELQYFHDYGESSTGITWPKKPLLSFSGAIGNGVFSVGGDVSFDTATRTFAKCNAGLSISNSIFDAALTLNDKADTVVASLYCPVNPRTNTAIAAELTRKIFSNEMTLSYGAQHSFFPSMLVKAGMNTNGGVGTLLQHELFGGFYVSVAGETNFRDITGSAKIGMSVALKH